MSGSPAVPYKAEQVCMPWSEKVLDWDADFHRLLLGDALRMRAYERAIREVVRPGSIVLDLGTGTGVLARWALESGASRVYGIERDAALLELATATLTNEGFENFVPVAGLSLNVDLPERVDLIISEILGNLVDNEDCCRIIGDARERFLAPHGQLLPWRAERYLVPVDAQRAHAAVAAAPRARPFDGYYDVILPRAGYLASPRVDRIFGFNNDAACYQSDLVFTVDRPGRFSGFKGWFVADLSPTVALDISGDCTARSPSRRTTSDSWRHAYLPVKEQVTVEPHDRIHLKLARSSPADVTQGPFVQAYEWTGAVWRDDRRIYRFTQTSGQNPSTNSA